MTIVPDKYLKNIILFLRARRQYGKMEFLTCHSKCVNVTTSVSGVFKMSLGYVHQIMHDLLQFRKVSPEWIPKQLTSRISLSSVLKNG